MSGSQFTHSGGGITVLQQSMIDAADTPFEDILEALVFQPLDMHRSTFEQPLPGSLQRNAASAHSIETNATNGGQLYDEIAAAIAEQYGWFGA